MKVSATFSVQFPPQDEPPERSKRSRFGRPIGSHVSLLPLQNDCSQSFSLSNGVRCKPIYLNVLRCKVPPHRPLQGKIRQNVERSRMQNVRNIYQLVLNDGERFYSHPSVGVPVSQKWVKEICTIWPLWRGLRTPMTPHSKKNSQAPIRLVLEVDL